MRVRGVLCTTAREEGGGRSEKFASQRSSSYSVLFCCEGDQPQDLFWAGRSNKKQEGFDSDPQIVCSNRTGMDIKGVVFM